MDYRITSDKNVLAAIAGNNYSEAAESLLKTQRTVWRDLNNNYLNIHLVKTKTLSFDGFRMKVQFNPARMKSTSAKTDGKTIGRRDCFLCAENLPVNQKGINIINDYILLCNPYPVFPEHFTVISTEHKQQKILTSFYNLLEISKKLGSKYSLIYNGPRCGASAPDHLHFQAGTKKFMPIEDDYYSLLNEYGESIKLNDETSVYAVDDRLRKFIGIESKYENIIFDIFSEVYKIHSKIMSPNEEPLLNIICSYYNETGWRIIVFLRDKHRSSHYFQNDQGRLAFSPAAIDVGGVCITPVEKDFERMDTKLLSEIFREVFPPDDVFDHFKSSLLKLFAG